MSALFIRRLKPFNKFAFTSRGYQNGYVVLIPEIGEDSPETNPLLKHDGLPEFNNITIENCRAAIAKQTLEFEEVVKKLGSTIENQYSNIFKELFEPLEKISLPLELTWGLSKTLYLGNSILMPTSSYMIIHDRACRARASKYINKGIYGAVKLASENKIAKTNEEKRLLRKFAVEGKLNGLELNDADRVVFIEHLNKLNFERNEFKNKTDISTKKFTSTITDSIVTREFPPDLLKATSVNPSQPLMGPWKITLQPHIYMKFMQYCSDRTLRWNIWSALTTRGSNMRNDELKTSLHLEEIRFARRNIAQLLGYSSYAEMSMETKMAESVQEVQNTIAILLERAKYSQEKELKELHDFALERGFQHQALELWDIPYWRRKQQSTLFGLSEEDIKNYFPLNTVLQCLFDLCENLFNIQIRQRSSTVAWHKDVKFYDIFEPHSSAPIAGFYLDPYARSEQKIKIENSGWMVAIQNLSRISERKPLAALIFNFDVPGEDTLSYLSFNEVKSLFFKFGHAMQHLLTRTNYFEVAGLSNIEWDVVETSGHVFSHWLLNRQVMNRITSHRDSKESMPSTTVDLLINAQKHMAGLDLSNELYLSALDLELHMSKEFWRDIIKQLWPAYLCFNLDPDDSHPLSFTQIFSEEWGAAYYSHIWSKMIAADIYSAFHEVQDDSQQIVTVGRRYRDTFLALGGSIHPRKVFREFRGRDPSPKALLSSLGLKKISEKNSN